jgi:hypothetical protein
VEPHFATSLNLRVAVHHQHFYYINSHQTSAFSPMKDIPYYAKDVDFDQLAKNDPDFAAIAQPAKQKGFINFKDPKVVQYV